MKRPRQCLPFAVISLNKNDLPLVRSPARPLMFTVTPLTSGKHFKEDAEVRLNLIMNCFIQKDNMSLFIHAIYGHVSDTVQSFCFFG